MLYLQKILGFLSHLDQSDWLIILTVAILGLTFAVVLYAKRTLRVTKESLDLFSNPVVKIVGNYEIHGPYGGGDRYIEPRTMLTICNQSPMDIVLPPPLAICRIVPEKSSDPKRAGAFGVCVERWRGHSLPTEPWVVSNTLTLEIILRGARLAKGAPALKLVTEFKVPSYLYRGKTHGPLIAICTFLIEPQ